MRSFQGLVALGILGVMASVGLAERPPQPRAKADLVVTGKVEKITTREKAWGGDGISTSYVARVKIDKVEKGTGVKDGDLIDVNWYRVTRSPTRPFAGAYGHAYAIKTKDQARFWLMGSAKTGWTVIYNRDGVEKLGK